ncbi:winged helix-turn-helix transcriptional regulator [Candidatus Saccharibacteria bacterium]|nr:winged helix-turn-helix transcriptional regulator [Candidatus Saccharibacteria bacterium]
MLSIFIYAYGIADKLQSPNEFPTPLLHLTYVLQQSADALLESSIGVGLSSVRVMSALSDRTPRSQQMVASQLRQTESYVSRQLRVMKKQNLVKVARNKKDGRQRDVVLTNNGKHKLQKAVKLLEAQQRRLLPRKDAKLFDQSVDKFLSHI